MASSAHKGTLLLSLAQVWHALSGYVIFITGARLLGIEDYGSFMLVVWTMTTLEIFVVDGVPRAVSWWVARVPEAALAITRRGFFLTVAIATGLLGALLLLAPAVGMAWGDPALVRVVRLSALDFLAFAGFAVVVQAVNGLREYSVQAGTWFIYSTAKVVLVVTFLKAGWGIEGGILGYLAGSLVGSLAAFAAGAPLVARGRLLDVPAPRQFLSFGTPLAAMSLALMALVNIDLWAAKRTAASAVAISVYGGAATLARSLFFVFKAFGDALFPAVARALSERRPFDALRVTRQGLAQLACLLLPACGLATGAAPQVLEVLYGDAAYRDGATILCWLAPAASLWALTAVLGAVVAATARPGRVAFLLLGVLVVEAVTVFVWAGNVGPIGAAYGSFAAAALGCVATLAIVVRTLGNVVPWAALCHGVVAGIMLDRALVIWSPPGWWVFPWGAALFGATVMASMAAGLMPALRNRPVT